MRRGVLLLLVLTSGCGKVPHRLKGPAPAFTLKDLGGGTLTLGSLQGKVVVLDFWATWCGPCLAELPDLSDFSRRNAPRGVEVIGVVFESGEPMEIADFVREHKIPYRQLIGDDSVQDAYGAGEGFPTTFVIDTKGQLVERTVGAVPDKFERLQKAVDGALSRS